MYETLRNLHGYSYRASLFSHDLIIQDATYCCSVDFEASHHHNFGEIYLGLEGTSVIRAGTEDYALEQGDLLYVGPLVSRRCVFQPTQDFGYFLFTFNLERRLGVSEISPKFVSDEMFLIQNMICHDSLQGKDECGCIYELQILCETFAHKTLGGLLRINNYLSNFFISAAQSFAKGRSRADFDQLVFCETTKNKAIRISDWIWKNCTEDLNLKEVSEHFNYSPRQIQRIIFDYFGIGFLDLLTQYRLGRAKCLLSHTMDSIELISQASGFHTAKNLRRNFKESFGVTPSKYRQCVHGEA
jgi:AraC-like DNA-binding protein